MAMKFIVAVIVESEGKVLLVKGRNGLWGPPGGHYEEQFDTSVISAALREAWEETGFDIYLESTPGLFLPGPATPLVFHKSSSWWGFVFRGKIVGGDGIPLDPEISEWKWFTEQEIHDLFLEGLLQKPELNLPTLVKRFTPKESRAILKGRKNLGITMYPAQLKTP